MLYTEEVLSQKIKKKNLRKKAKNIVICIIVLPLLLYNISLVVQAIVDSSETPSFFGIKTYVVISGSMEPEIQIGDIVVAKNAKNENLNVGDIICFRQGQSVVTHRISQKNEEGDDINYKTKGDNNNAEDTGTITKREIEGKVIKIIPKLGKVSLMLQNKIAIVVIIVIFYIYLMHAHKINQKKDERNFKRLKYENEKANENKE